MDLNDEIDAAARERAMVMMFKVLFGALAHLDPKFDPETCREVIKDKLNSAMPDDRSEVTTRMRAAAFEFTDRVMGDPPS